MRRWIVLAVGLLVAGRVLAGMEDPKRYEKDVAAMEARAAAKPAPTNAILFVGSSNIRLWSTLAEDFSGWPVINHGFGGCHLSDVAFYIDRLVVPFKPRAVVISAGVNDLHHGRTPQEVFESATAAVSRIQAALPGVPVVFASLLPAPSRTGELDRVREANRLVAGWVQNQAGVVFSDGTDLFQKPDGSLREDLYIEDRLHHTREAYRLRAERLRADLLRLVPATSVSGKT
jgi:lysophospholipase L1-like esterase